MIPFIKILQIGKKIWLEVGVEVTLVRGSDRKGHHEGILGHWNCFFSWCGWWLCACILFVKIHCPVPLWIMPFSICTLYFINKFTCKKYRHCLIYLELTTNWVWICFRGTCASSEKISCYHFSVLWICSPWVDPRYHLQEHMELLQARQSKVLFRSLFARWGMNHFQQTRCSWSKAEKPWNGSRWISFNR